VPYGDFRDDRDAAAAPQGRPRDVVGAEAGVPTRLLSGVRLRALLVVRMVLRLFAAVVLGVRTLLRVMLRLPARRSPRDVRRQE
jgi:hypothetical protein